MENARLGYTTFRVVSLLQLIVKTWQNLAQSRYRNRLQARQAKLLVLFKLNSLKQFFACWKQVKAATTVFQEMHTEMMKQRSFASSSLLAQGVRPEQFLQGQALYVTNKRQLPVTRQAGALDLAIGNSCDLFKPQHAVTCLSDDFRQYLTSRLQAVPESNHVLESRG